MNDFRIHWSPCLGIDRLRLPVITEEVTIDLAVTDAKAGLVLALSHELKAGLNDSQGKAPGKSMDINGTHRSTVSRLTRVSSDLKFRRFIHHRGTSG